MKKVTLNDKIRAYCAQQLDHTQDANLAMKVVVMAPLALLANETALAQCNAGTVTENPNFAFIDIDNDGTPEFQVDDNVRLWFTLNNNACSVAVDTGNGWNGYTSVFQSAAAPDQLATSIYLPAQNFLSREALNYYGSTHGYGALDIQGGVWPGPPVSGFVGVRCDWDGDGNFNYGFFFLDFDNAGDVTVDLSISGVDNVDDNLGIVGFCSSIGGVLPVELVQFEANFVDDQVVLQWKTLTEIENMGFQVERSTNGKDFHKVGWIDGSGTTTQSKDYQLIDETLPQAAILYYRLSQTDFDGSVSQSEVVSVMVSANKALVSEFQPNRVQSGQDISLVVDLTENNTPVEVRTFDMRGRQVAASSFQQDRGKHLMAFQTHELVAGVYFASITIGGETFHRKFYVLD
ncbi:MAG: T9SS type A sorting domain-containing protein [Bacteroidota bacterium]